MRIIGAGLARTTTTTQMVADSPDLLTSIRAEIDARLGELRPLLAEYEELLSVADALASDGPGGASDAIASPVTPGRSGRGSATTARSTARAPRSPASARAKKTARPKPARRARTRKRGPDSAASRAILAALEHGSHTVAELVMVTALPAPDIRDGLRRLRAQRAITKTDRDGKAAYALSTTTG